MSKPISLFADYHQPENILTNHCGLVMKLLYEESPKRFQEFLVTIAGSGTDLVVGPVFNQQSKGKNSIPDLTIVQNSFSVFFEVKRTNWFYDEQLINHIKGFNKSIQTKILFLLCNFEEDNISEQVKESVQKAKEDGVVLQPLSLENFVDALENSYQNTSLSYLVEEFREFLDRNNYLPKWKYLLDVVSSSGTLHEVNDGVYMCPNSGGAYTHQRAKYFGAYSDKAVRTIHEIRAVLVVEKGLKSVSISWNNSGESEELLKLETLNKINQWSNRIEEINAYDLQVFLLSEGFETYFYKQTSGGMLQSKKYFREIAAVLKADTAQELAQKLNNHNWGEFDYLNQ
ncbi:hypothetical protein [Runella slithyformis]|uniref:PD-(D/E)XK nuclease superfamily protein n=1 Tax=Runella slithyformis (strain ATCC 29530 / DSM 19594 / LMG 11500 / NCIMB 11436 / LSU 4) TaxID=761193 RepID=A0A7U4E7F3_RUNSL|nr:hypothetical protein [Runella slithyformis]AEI50621.1 hypothetical protein Runsl_4281 [Runella slithyformis DSM 19594]